MNGNRVNKEITPYLFGIEYKKYDFQECVKYFEKHRPNFGDAMGQCSEVRVDVNVGRNLDYYINGNAAAIIKVNKYTDSGVEPKIIKHASIGVVGCCSDFTLELARSGVYDDIYRYLPCRTVDGINDCGVYVGVNVVPTGETVNPGKDYHYKEWGYGAAFTEATVENAPKYCTLYLTRYILDNASSAKEAIDLIQQVRWYDPVKYPSDDQCQSFHWMISDMKSNYIVEFIENKLRVLEATGYDLSTPGLKTIMTNFNNVLFDQGVVQPHGSGYERYEILCKNYGRLPIYELMDLVLYSNTYTRSVDDEGFFASEYNEFIPMEELYPHLVKSDKLKKIVAKANKAFTAWKALPEEQKYTPEVQAKFGLWYTEHTSLYEIKSPYHLSVRMHEGFEDGDTHFYGFDFGVAFPDPLEGRN